MFGKCPRHYVTGHDGRLRKSILLTSDGKKAEDYIKEAREKIAKTLKVTEKEIIFTSGGTESNNLAIIGSAMANQRAGKHIITTAIEHASVAAVVSF